MKKITIFFVFLVVFGYIVSGFIWGFSGLGGISAAILLYFASNKKESRVAREMREAREDELKEKLKKRV